MDTQMKRGLTVALALLSGDSRLSPGRRRG